VIEALQRPDGSCEFLAVAPTSAADAGAVGDARAAGEANAGAGEPLGVRELPLPYALPE
jgi:hypothetical protein